MSNNTGFNLKEVLYILAALTIVIAGLKNAADLIVPFLLASFIAIVCAPLLNWQTRHGVPTIIGVGLLMLALILIGFALIGFIGGTVNDFYQDVPVYEAKIQRMMSHSVTWLNQKGLEIKADELSEIINPKAAMGMVAKAFNSLGSVLINVFLILFTVIFILLEASGFPAKIKRAFGEDTRALLHFDAFVETVQKYLLIKTALSVANGVIIGLLLALMGLEYWALWALTAFLLNYIPNIGSIIAAVPAILIALIQLSVTDALIVAGIYIVINTLLGNVLEPKLMGKSLGLSSLVVFITLVFWGWILGPVGMLLSIPLTIIAKVALDNSEKSKWLGTLLEQ